MPSQISFVDPVHENLVQQAVHQRLLSRIQQQQQPMTARQPVPVVQQPVSSGLGRNLTGIGGAIAAAHLASKFIPHPAAQIGSALLGGMLPNIIDAVAPQALDTIDRNIPTSASVLVPAAMVGLGILRKGKGPAATGKSPSPVAPMSNSPAAPTPWVSAVRSGSAPTPTTTSVPMQSTHVNPWVPHPILRGTNITAAPAEMAHSMQAANTTPTIIHTTQLGGRPALTKQLQSMPNMAGDVNVVASPKIKKATTSARAKKITTVTEKPTEAATPSAKPVKATKIATTPVKASKPEAKPTSKTGKIKTVTRVEETPTGIRFDEIQDLLRKHGPAKAAIEFDKLAKKSGRSALTDQEKSYLEVAAEKLAAPPTATDHVSRKATRDATATATSKPEPKMATAKKKASPQVDKPSAKPVATSPEPIQIGNSLSKEEKGLFKALASGMEKQVAEALTHKDRIGAVRSIMSGESKEMRQALKDHLKSVNPDLHERMYKSKAVAPSDAGQDIKPLPGDTVSKATDAGTVSPSASAGKESAHQESVVKKTTKKPKTNK